MSSLEPTLAELNVLHRVHVEGAEVAEEVVHLVHPKPVVLNTVLIGCAAADIET